MSVAKSRKQDTDEYTRNMAAAREARAEVAESLCSAIKDSDRLSSRQEVAERIAQIVAIERRISQAIGLQEQARDVGSPIAPHVRLQREQEELRLEAVMSLAVSCGGWVAAEILKREVSDGQARLKPCKGADAGRGGAVGGSSNARDAGRDGGQGRCGARA